jgi:chromosome partitioning protein
MNIISLFNQKGGVGKTTSAVNIGAGLVQLGKRVLLIDLDPQASLTVSLGFNPTDSEVSVYELLDGKATTAQAIRSREGLDVIPSAIQLAGAELQLAGVPGREMLLRDALRDLADYDFVLIDCPPSLGLLTLNALTASKSIYIPIQAEFLPMQGLKQLIDTVSIVQRRLNPGLEIAGVITTFYDPRKVLQRQVLERIKERFGHKVFNSMIRVNVALAEAPSVGKTIFEYQPDSHGAKDYLRLCQEILGADHE